MSAQISGKWGPETFGGVAAQIVVDLSMRTYPTFARAIKELVSNAYDADAENLWVTLDLKNNAVLLQDDGEGMLPEDFRLKFTRISGSTRRAEGRYTKKGRLKIGKIGIGVLAIAPMCKQAHVVSKRAGTKIGFEAVIDYRRFFDPKKSKLDVGDVYNYKWRSFEDETNRHYTKIYLKGLPKRVIEKLKEKGKSANERVKSISEWNGEQRFFWELSTIIPIEYPKGNPIYKQNEEILSDKRIAPINVWFNGKKLTRPMYEGSIAANYPIMNEFVEYRDPRTGKKRRMEIRGFIIDHASSVYPREMQGVITRVNNVGIGGYNYLGYAADATQRPFLCGEIHVFDENPYGLEDAMLIHREGFWEEHDAYRSYRDYMYVKFKSILKETRERYDERKEEEEEKKEKKTSKQISKAITTVFRETAKAKKKEELAKKKAEKVSKPVEPVKPEKIAEEKVEEVIPSLPLSKLSKINFQYEKGQWDIKLDPCKIDLDTGKVTINSKFPILRRIPKRSRKFVEQMVISWKAAQILSEGDIKKMYNEAFKVMHHILGTPNSKKKKKRKKTT